MILIERLAAAKSQLKPHQTDYRVVFEDDVDSPAKVLVPDPNFMAAAMAGGILPPVEVFHQLEVDEHGRVTNGHVLQADPIGPMSEEEAIEYLIEKDIPETVWKKQEGNRTTMVICKASQLPSRRFRNAWSINNV